MLNIDKQQNGSVLSITLSGRLDTTTAPMLDDDLKDLSSITSLSLDIKDLEYMSSAGLRVLLMSQKQMRDHGEMFVKYPQDSVMEIFEVTGFTDILTIVR
jgi:anti-sigma B factor antagonist